MNSSIDVADLIPINKLLYNCSNQLVVERAGFYSSFINILSNRAIDLNNNKIQLIELLEGTDWNNEFAEKAFMNEWKKSVKFKYLTDYDAETLEFECWVVGALEAYKTVLNTTSLTSFMKRSVLMDQKYFLQEFLIELIKYRESNSSIQKSALYV